MAVLFTEVSPRRQAEIAIENLTARNQAILAAVPDIIAEVDAERRYTWLNAAGLDFFGADAVGKAADCYFEGFQDNHEVVQPLFEGDENIVYVESWQRRKDGGKRLLAWWRRVLKDAQGNVTGALSTARDVTEHKLAERELRRLNRTLDARNRELQSIVYAASHDLRSPLVNIQGFGGELAECCSGIRGLLANVDGDEEWSKGIRALVEKDVPEALGFIRASARKMQTLLDGLLSVSRVGSVELVVETIDMNALLHSVIAAMQYQIDGRNAEIVVGPLPACRGDAGQINQVFSNLIANALKYASGAGRPRVRVTGTVEKEEVVYCVADNGIGIASEHHEKIFEIFHRLNPRDTHEGEGIGLTIVSRILDRHDGRVWVESELEKGSRFFVALPNA
jgi:PAS domain S-box-containing protein